MGQELPESRIRYSIPEVSALLGGNFGACALRARSLHVESRVGAA